MYTIFRKQKEEARRQANPSILVDRLALVFISLVLVHGLVAAPLLVNCIPADGRSLVELVGQDPCHHAFGAMEASCSRDLSRDVFGPGDPVDPCVDVSLDSTGVFQNGVDLPVPHIGASAQLVPDLHGAGTYYFVSDGCASFKLAREPIIITNCVPGLTSSLRI